LKKGFKVLLILLLLLFLTGIPWGARQVSAQPQFIPEMELHLGSGEEGPEGLVNFLQLLLLSGA